jgi:ribosomal protein L18E
MCSGTEKAELVGIRIEKAGSGQNIEDYFWRNVVRRIKKGSHFKPYVNLFKIL